MLQSLQIKNVALISELSLSFERGFSVLIGETGAGKSIILDSLGFVLGGKVEKSLIRSGENQMRVEAMFGGVNKGVMQLLSEQGIECDGEVLISRTLSHEGRNECRINGTIVLLSMLKTVALNLVDSYAQHDSIVLLSSKKHQAILDGCAANEIEPLKQQLEQLLQQKSDINKRIDTINGEGFSFETRKEFLTYQVNEIAAISPQSGEDEVLQEKRQQLLNYEKNASALTDIVLALEGDGTGLLATKLKQVQKQVAHFALQNKQFEELSTRTESIALELADVYDTIKDFAQNFYYDEKDFQATDARYDKIKTLKQKYGPTLNDVLDFYQKSQQQLFDLENSEFLLSKLAQEKQVVLDKLQVVANQLTQKRKEVAARIEKQMVGQLVQLGMKHAQFKVMFAQVEADANKIGKNGLDDIEFLFSANKGEELKSLSKTISGGELSRFMLAFKNILVTEDSVQVLVFDEIDSGISGETASVVAQKLGQLAQQFQILCITHLPQVASMGDNYFYVSKLVQGNATFTKVEVLDLNRQIEEIARLSGGAQQSQHALLHAKELKAWSNQFKQSL